MWGDLHSLIFYKNSVGRTSVIEISVGRTSLINIFTRIVWEELQSSVGRTSFINIFTRIELGWVC